MPIDNPAVIPTNLYASNTEVLSSTIAAAATFYDLDLSSVVGANLALVLLRFYNSVAEVTSFYARANGETELAATQASGYRVAVTNASQCHVSILTMTDINGVVEWACSRGDNRAITIDVIGYLVN